MSARCQRMDGWSSERSRHGGEIEKTAVGESRADAAPPQLGRLDQRPDGRSCRVLPRPDGAGEGARRVHPPSEDH
jgi:hypothetical protein